MILNQYDIDYTFNNQKQVIDIISKSIFSNSLSSKSLANLNSLSLNNNIDIYNLDELRVLSVEDNYSNQKVLNKMLNELGISDKNITSLFDGVNFVENIEKGNQYDLVFIDLKMPRLNGIDATKEIIKKNMKSNMFFVAITATITDETIKECFKIGMDAFISKPIQINNLADIIKIVVKKYNKI
jgi:CheY-like chemotaxis protein